MRTPSKTVAVSLQRPAILDAGCFRSFLDNLVEALANPFRNSSETGKSEEFDSVGEGLRAVVDAVKRRDPVVSYQSLRDPEFENKIRILTRGVQDSYFAWLTHRLSPAKISALRKLLSHPIPNFLDIIGKNSEENANSDIIRWLLDPRESKVVAPSALCALVSSFENAMEWQSNISASIERNNLSVRREYAVFTEEAGEEAIGRLDLLISGPNFKLIIENKIFSDEHENQTNLYWDWLKNESGHLKAGLFLTPGGFPAENRNFKPLSYIDLLSCLLEGPAKASVEGLEQQVLASYVKTLATGVLQRELNILGEHYE